MEKFKRAWQGYWESVTWNKAIVSSAGSAAALLFGWYFILRYPGYAEEQGVTIDPGKMIIGIIGMVVITLFAGYWHISMFVAASDNEKRRR